MFQNRIHQLRGDQPQSLRLPNNLRNISGIWTDFSIYLTSASFFYVHIHSFLFFTKLIFFYILYIYILSENHCLQFRSKFNTLLLNNTSTIQLRVT